MFHLELNSYNHHLHLGFSAVNKSCVCNTPHHIVYWRSNFDERTQERIYRRLQWSPKSGRSNQYIIKYETEDYEIPSSNRKSEILNQQTGKGFTIKSSAHEGIANNSEKETSGFKKSSNQFDDGVVALGSTPEAQIENIENL